MKKLSLFLFVIACISFASCRLFDHDITISYSDTDRYYSMKAYFNLHRTRDVEEYMDNRLGEVSSMSFVNTKIDGQIALDDHTTFYIKKYPGFVQIKLDKEKNSNQSYERVRSMCEGIKKILVK